MTQYQFVPTLPDLIHYEDYKDDRDGRLVRIRITQNESGIEVLGDAVNPKLLEKLLEHLGPKEIEQMLCG